MSKQLNINFSDEKLNLDYLSFNLPSFRPHMLEVAEIFYIRLFLHLKLTPGTKIIYLYILNRQILGKFIF